MCASCIRDLKSFGSLTGGPVLVGLAGFGFILLTAALSMAAAQEIKRDVATPSACQWVGFAGGEVAGQVRHVVDSTNFILDDGRAIVLAGIAPMLSKDAAANAAGLTALKILVEGQTVSLSPAAPRDRYGRIKAQVFVMASDAATLEWAQHALIANGHAQVASDVGDQACATWLQRAEAHARTRKLGLWNNPRHDFDSAEDVQALSTKLGQFARVEGRVISVRESGGTIYVNFGRRWSEDFTVTIAKKNESAFVTSGVGPKRLAGQRIRVRGVIEQRGGPWIDAVRPEQIEIIERNELSRVSKRE